MRYVTRVLLTCCSCLLLLTLGDRVGTAPPSEADGPAVVATLPAPVQRLWPGGGGAFLAETRGHVYLWRPDAGVKELAVLGGDHWLPQTSLGWSPDRLAIATQSELHVLLPQPERHISFASHVDLCEQAGLIITSSPPPGPAVAGIVSPDAYRVAIFTLDGKPAPEWKETVNGRIATDCARIDGNWRIALGNYTFDDAACRLLDERGSMRWKTDLPNEHEVSAVKLSGSTGTVLVALKRFSTDTTWLWLLQAEDGTLLSRIGLPQDYVRGLQLSPNGRWAVAWSWYDVTLIDIAARRIAWTGRVDDDPQDWRCIHDADVADDGRVVAVHGFAAQSTGPVTLHAFDAAGRPQPFWTSPEELNYDTVPGGRSLFLQPDGRRVFVRYGKEVVSVPVPAAATLPQTSTAQLPAHLARLSPKEREILAIAMASSNKPDAMEMLKALTADPDGAVRAAVVCGLLARRDPQAVPLLLDLLKNEWDPTVRLTIIGALGETNDARAVEPLIDLLKETRNMNSAEYKALENALVRLGKTAVPLLIQHLKDPEFNRGVPVIPNLLGRMKEKEGK